jgi:hypothetical protein
MFNRVFLGNASGPRQPIEQEAAGAEPIRKRDRFASTVRWGLSYIGTAEPQAAGNGALSGRDRFVSAVSRGLDSLQGVNQPDLNADRDWVDFGAEELSVQAREQQEKNEPMELSSGDNSMIASRQSSSSSSSPVPAISNEKRPSRASDSDEEWCLIDSLAERKELSASAAIRELFEGDQELIKTHGIFRISPPQRELNELQERLPTDFEGKNPHLIAGYLKSLFCKEPRIPLAPEAFSFQTFQQLEKLVQLDPEKAICLLRKLFEGHNECAKKYFLLLSKVAAHSRDNEMLPYNLGVTTNPALIAGLEFDEAAQCMKPTVAAFIIEHAGEIFVQEVDSEAPQDVSPDLPKRSVLRVTAARIDRLIAWREQFVGDSKAKADPNAEHKYNALVAKMGYGFKERLIRQREFVEQNILSGGVRGDVDIDLEALKLIRLLFS